MGWNVYVLFSFFLFAVAVSCCFLLREWGNIKLKLTALPRIFIHAVCLFNSTAFAIQLVFWRVLQFP